MSKLQPETKNGELSNHFNPRRIVAAGLLIVATVNILFSLQKSLTIMAILWGINGFAQSAGWPPVGRIISEHFDIEQRRHLSPYLAMSYMFGTAFTWAVTGWLIARNGWQTAFLVPGLALLFFLGVWWYSGVDAVATTEPHQRNFRWQGETYHHIIDPRTGYPARGTASVTVLHSDAATADAAATALFVAGPEDWHRIARQMGVSMVLLLAENGDLYMNPAMRARIRLIDESTARIHLSPPLPAAPPEQQN